MMDAIQWAAIVSLVAICLYQDIRIVGFKRQISDGVDERKQLAFDILLLADDVDRMKNGKADA
jgi:hypothetical protein